VSTDASPCALPRRMGRRRALWVRVARAGELGPPAAHGQGLRVVADALDPHRAKAAGGEGFDLGAGERPRGWRFSSRSAARAITISVPPRRTRCPIWGDGLPPEGIGEHLERVHLNHQIEALRPVMRRGHQVGDQISPPGAAGPPCSPPVQLSRPAGTPPGPQAPEAGPLDAPGLRRHPVPETSWSPLWPARPRAARKGPARRATAMLAATLMCSPLSP
jgi:hypothetical protein